MAQQFRHPKYSKSYPVDFGKIRMVLNPCKSIYAYLGITHYLQVASMHINLDPMPTKKKGPEMGMHHNS